MLCPLLVGLEHATNTTCKISLTASINQNITMLCRHAKQQIHTCVGLRHGTAQKIRSVCENRVLSTTKLSATK